MIMKKSIFILSGNNLKQLIMQSELLAITGIKVFQLLHSNVCFLTLSTSVPILPIMTATTVVHLTKSCELYQLPGSCRHFQFYN